jgi:hypothetical protein
MEIHQKPFSSLSRLAAGPEQPTEVVAQYKICSNLN